MPVPDDGTCNNVTVDGLIIYPSNVEYIVNVYISVFLHSQSVMLGICMLMIAVYHLVSSGVLYEYLHTTVYK